MDESTLLRTVADILEIDIDEVSLSDELEVIGWDSLSNISFIAEVDTAVGLTIDADALAEAVTVADLKALVDAGA
ncbi:acyl carrier protein [Agromyces sp. MMS24-JH15]|uniref:acyl carrier protein n=1 Tax=Agromyces sp. MMS24-JH15 TaxID=3243765 RepID=UPI003748232A